ncbi:hypothetical protein TVAG_140990 [Trichomonas vaginalis G3]|uniref:Uncharacterized protein n=1 Tax=Trichomonas vaginalis (strain ATCC PRA-98 / G3) TaxID=412133 RepID=A2FES3_TRIV3|nr:hypothetical protein TVAGG3_0603900 [Trichomonas vaginalis G3]EAX96610.1 hypothetical protein TVAG_140990 [Trichomonas vaginalis G3]KAI5524109.1 hypothetical protein TVAGG3_0603900 [Trichomonas vaginalis G3]|eukprot:XP_001309540.1 hypothetical protein [Trichomonas vaginalis G3]
MFLYFLSNVLCATSTVHLLNTIDFVRNCPEEETSYVFDYMQRSDFIVAVVEAPANVKLQYSYPAGTSPVDINMSFPALRFPKGNVQIVANLTKDQCVTLAHVTLPTDQNTACINGFKIITTQKMNYTMQADEKNKDTCVFYAPGAQKLMIGAQAYLNGDKMYVYRDDMVSGSYYDIFTGTRSVYPSPTSPRPFVFDLKTQDSEPGHVTILGEVKDPYKNMIEYEGEVKSVPPVDFGLFNSKYAIFPILGMLPTLLLIGGWVYAFCRILKKKPITIN